MKRMPHSAGESSLGKPTGSITSSSPSKPGILELCIRRAGVVTGALHRARRGGQRHIPLEITRVASEIFLSVELQGVDEQRHDDGVAPDHLVGFPLDNP